MEILILMVIEKNLEAGIPEKMRVIKDFDGTYQVQTYSEAIEKYITQAVWANPRKALQDCANWYLVGEGANFPRLY